MKMSNCERTVAMNIIDLFVQRGFISAFKNTSHSMYNWMYDNGLLRNGYDYADGATKCVFMYDGLDSWVIKCRYPGMERDYCARECENYALAEEAGFGFYFAATEFLCEVDGIAFYVQERVDCDESVDCLIKDRLQCDYEDSNTPYDEDSLWEEVEELDAYSRIMLLYGDEALARFICERRINDLHCGNFGIRGDSYVMVDFSGFGMAVWG